MPARRALSADPTLDLSHLTDAEKRQLVHVVQRDSELQEAERIRIVKLKSLVRQEDRSAEALLQRGDFNERYCIRCYRRFMLLINPWVCCCLCSLRVCRRRCASRSREFSGGFICYVCDKSRVCLNGQCQWFYDAVKKKFKASGSSKVIVSLNRDAVQFAEACQSASGLQQNLPLDQLFTSRTAPASAVNRQLSLDSTDGGVYRQPQHQLLLNDSGRGGSLNRRGLYRTELTLATKVDSDFDIANLGAAAAIASIDAIDETAASTVGLQITAFQGQLHHVLRRLQTELRARVSDERDAAGDEGKEVADRYGREIADLISGFAQTLHATLASREGSPCSVEARLHRVQRVVQQEVENAIGLSVDRVVHRPGSVAGGSSITASAVAAAAAAAAGSEDGEDSGLELEGRLADFVVQKIVDDHLVMLEEEAATEAAEAARRSSPVGAGGPAEHFFTYRQLPSSLTPVHHRHVQPQAPSSFRMQNDFGMGTTFATSSGRMRAPEPASGRSTSGAATDTDSQVQLDQHIDSLFAFKSAAQQQLQQQQQPQISSTPKAHRHRRDAAALERRRSDRLATQPLLPTPPMLRSDLRLGRFASRIAHDSCSDTGDWDSEDESDSGDSWDKDAPVFALTSEAPPLLLRFGRIDWAQNERTDPRFCVKPAPGNSTPRGERVTFKAVIDGTEPIEVLWHRLKSGRAYEICDSDKYELTSDPDGDRSYTLTIYHASEADAGAYLLIAANQLRAVMHGFKLQVVENSEPFRTPAFAEPMTDTRAREGRTARFCCQVTGLPVPRVSFLRDGRPIKADGVKHHITNQDNGTYELLVNDVNKSDDAEYSCLATNAAGSTQCDCQLLVYRLAEDDEALRRIEGEIQQTQASMITAAKDMYRASGKIRQLDANFGRLNQRLNSMERQLATVEPTYPESNALQRITGHMIQRLADHDASSATEASTAPPDASAESVESSFETPAVSDWSMASSSGGGGEGCGVSLFESIPQTWSTSKIVYEIENVEASPDDGRDDLASTERRIYVAASKSNLLRQKLDELERQISAEDSSGATFDAESMERAIANLQLLTSNNEAEVDSIEMAASQMVKGK